MNQLSKEKQLIVMWLLDSGVSLRGVARLLGVHRNTVFDLNHNMVARRQFEDAKKLFGRAGLGEYVQRLLQTEAMR